LLNIWSNLFIDNNNGRQFTVVMFTLRNTSVVHESSHFIPLIGILWQ